MENGQENSACAFCGYTAVGRFVGDVCPQCGLIYWKCSHCGVSKTAEKTTDVCPECGEKCDFINVSCYIPECGSPGKIDSRF